MVTYFAKYRMLNLPELDFKVRSHGTRAGWYSPKDNTMYINPDFMINDLRVLRGIVYHETIHYVDQWVNPQINSRSRAVIDRVSHGGFFKEMMEKINKREGYELVTVKQAIAENWKSNRDFFVYILVESNGKLGGFWSAKHDEQIDEKLRTGYGKYFKGFIYFSSGLLEYKKLPRLSLSQMKRGIKYGRFEDLKLPNEELENVENLIKKQIHESFFWDELLEELFIL